MTRRLFDYFSRCRPRLPEMPPPRGFARVIAHAQRFTPDVTILLCLTPRREFIFADTAAAASPLILMSF